MCKDDDTKMPGATHDAGREMNRLFQILMYACVFTVVVAAPWLFGAWEMWWFWPFAGLIFLGTACCGFLMMSGWRDGKSLFSSRARWVVMAFAPFLAYAWTQSCRTAVWQDAERSFMLHLTAFLLAVDVVFFMSERAQKLLLWTMLANLALIGIYGIVNHIFWGSARVLWVQGYETYLREHRATGSYFCPDHFAGAMEIMLAIAMGVVLARESALKIRLLGVVSGSIGLVAVILTKSRGAGITLMVMGITALLWGFHQWPVRMRMWWRLLGIACATLLFAIVVACARSYVDRFISYWAGGGTAEDGAVSRMERLARVWRASSRGRMYGGALRAWHTSPIWGIGPGMHQNLWPHFAATEDGDREAGVWPSMPNYDFHSYEVHSDWLQLMEEQGIAGLVLFVVAAGVGLMVLLNGIRAEAFLWARAGWRRGRGSGCFAPMLGGLLAAVAMAFHSLGDFNLQIPANTWLLTATVACGIASASRVSENGRVYSA